MVWGAGAEHWGPGGRALESSLILSTDTCGFVLSLYQINRVDSSHWSHFIHSQPWIKLICVHSWVALAGAEPSQLSVFTRKKHWMEISDIIKLKVTRID